MHCQEEKDLFPQIALNLLKPPSLKPAICRKLSLWAVFSFFFVFVPDSGQIGIAIGKILLINSENKVGDPQPYTATTKDFGSKRDFKGGGVRIVRT